MREGKSSAARFDRGASEPPAPGAVIDVREEIANASVGPYHLFLAALIGMVVFFDGYDTFNPAYVIHYVMKPWHLAPSEAGLIVSSGLIGFMIGALLQGKLSDRHGRRATLLAALWIATLFSFATAAFARSFVAFCVFRGLTGIGLGTLLPLGVTYVNEYAPRRLANTFSMWGWALGWAAGGIVAAAIGVYLTPSLGWQALYYAASLSIVLVLVCHFALPESLQFAAMRGRWQKIAATLSRLNPSRASRYSAPGQRFTFPEPSDRPASVSLLLSQQYRRTTLSVWVAGFFVLFGIWGLTGWVPTAMMQRGEQFATSFGGFAIVWLHRRPRRLGSRSDGAMVDGRRCGSWHFGARQPARAERLLRWRRRLLHFGRAKRAQQFHRCIVRYRSARHRRRHDARSRTRRRNSGALHHGADSAAYSRDSWPLCGHRHRVIYWRRRDCLCAPASVARYSAVG